MRPMKFAPVSNEVLLMQSKFRESSTNEGQIQIFEMLVRNKSSSKPVILHLNDHIVVQLGLLLTLDPSESIYEFIHFQDGDLALKFILAVIEKDYKIHCLITDFNHPGINGVELAQKLQEITKGKGLASIPVILYSGLDAESSVVKGAISNGDISKHFNYSASSHEIINAIQSCI